MLIVMKFGGTSLRDPSRLEGAAARIAGEIARGNQVVTVVSAQGDTTDVLLENALAVPQRRRPGNWMPC